jgi:DTW domain-containing protein YfiP
MKQFDNKVKVTIIMHHREKHLTTNTATLAIKTLKNSKLVMRGLPEKPFTIDQLELADDEIPFFLFPNEEAEVINEDFINRYKDKKLHLIVPDGTWSQAKKVYRREKSMHQIKCLKLPDGIKSVYKLRKTPREDGVCTFEAISHSLKLLESNELYINLMSIFQVMVERFIKARYTFHNDD